MEVRLGAVRRELTQLDGITRMREITIGVDMLPSPLFRKATPQEEMAYSHFLSRTKGEKFQFVEDYGKDIRNFMVAAQDGSCVAVVRTRWVEVEVLDVR